MKDCLNFNAENKTFKDVFEKDSIFVVPPFQRDYSWTTEELEDLWEDMRLAQQENTRHYLGYLVFQDSPDGKCQRIIDGQQRLTSISILICATLKKIKKQAEAGNQDARQRYDYFRNKYIGKLDPVSLVTDAKITLNRHNKDFYQEYVTALVDFPRRGIIDTNKLIKKSFEFFENRIGQLGYTDSEEYAGFLEQVATTFFFTVITVSDELNAFRVFETLNARGVQLSSSDLLKNYILSIVCENPREFTKVEEDWEKIVRILGTEKFPEYLRYFWNSQHKLVRKTELFKAIRREITTRKQVFSLMGDLREKADLYMALQDSSDEMWNSAETQLRDDLYCLAIFGMKQHISLLFSVFELGDGIFKKVVHWLMILSFRYNIICERQPNEQETLYNEIALAIANKRINAAEEIKAELMKIYPADNMFRPAFAERSMDISNQQKNKIVKYILCAIEDYLEPPSSTDFQDANLSIEHIFPEHPEEGWPEFRSEAEAEKVYCFGNYTLLPRKTNRDLANKAYSEKRLAYQQTDYKMTRMVASQFEQWNIGTIAQRQQALAKLAQTIWRIS